MQQVNQRSGDSLFRATPRILIRALRVSFSTQSRVSLCVKLAGFVVALFPVMISGTLSSLTDQVQELYGSGNDKLAGAIRTFGWLALLYIIQLGFQALQGYFSNLDTLNIQAYIKESVMRCTCRVPYKYVENYNNFKEKIVFADTYAGYRVAQSIQSIIAWIQHLITFVSIMLVLYNVHPAIAIVLISTCLPSTILAYRQKDEDYLFKAKYMKEGAFVIHYYHDCCAQHTLNEVRYFGLFDYLKQKWKRSANHYIGKKNTMTKVHVVHNSIADLLRNGIYIAVLLIVVREIFQNPLAGLGTFMLVLTLAGQLQDTTARLLVVATQFVGDAKFMRDFFELEDLEADTVDKDAVPLAAADICFRNVTFTYPGAEAPAIRNLNLTIRQGEKVCILGENGSGKTTFVNLLCGLYEPDSGEITINGEKIASQLAKVRSSISTVFQDFGRYEATLRENIVVSDYRRVHDDAVLNELAVSVGAESLIHAKASGFDDLIGTFSEEGSNLSGGEWQKIAIMRAAYRDNVRVMILDEPTAALDPEAEADLYRNFTRLTGDKTTLLISHRLGIAGIVDRILVFDQGRIVEDGSHSALIKHGGGYSQMYKEQTKLYV
jgi:ATP-binding cassette subfamily B protein